MKWRDVITKLKGLSLDLFPSVILPIMKLNGLNMTIEEVNDSSLLSPLIKSPQVFWVSWSSCFRTKFVNVLLLHLFSLYVNLI